jgi:hypothetical protein
MPVAQAWALLFADCGRGELTVFLLASAVPAQGSELQEAPKRSKAFELLWTRIAQRGGSEPHGEDPSPGYRLVLHSVTKGGRPCLDGDRCRQARLDSR